MTKPKTKSSRTTTEPVLVGAAAAESAAMEPVALAHAAPTTTPPAKPATKLGLLVDLLHQPEGTTLEAMMAATGWQSHSVRGALAGSLKKSQGLAIGSVITQTGRRYFIAAALAS